MRESVQNLVQAISQGDALETEKAFAAAMAEKLAPMLDARRQEVAQSMFDSQEETVSVDTADVSGDGSSSETAE